MLEGFKPFSFGNTGPAVSITKNGVTFNRFATEKLGKPPYVQLLINDHTHQFAIKKTSLSDPNALPFMAAIKEGAPSVRWNNKELLRIISGMASWDLNAPGCKGYRIPAVFDRTEAALVFSLAAAIENT